MSFFPRLPIDLRRQIWCLAARPATVYLYLAESEGAVRFRVLLTPALLACREAHDFLRFLYAPAQNALPSWFRFDVDTIRCRAECLPQVSRLAWCSLVETLVVCDIREAAEIFLGPSPVKFSYIETHFTALRYLTLEVKAESRTMANHWLVDSWMWFMEDLYNDEAGRQPVPYQIHVVSPGEPEEEWLTPMNYLRVWHVWQKKRNAYLNKTREEYEDEIVLKSMVKHHAVVESDDDLDDPAAWFKKRRPFLY